jgi:hypothetical protein
LDIKLKIKLKKYISDSFFLELKPEDEDDELQLQSLLKKQRRDKVKIWISTEESKGKIDIMRIDLVENDSI